MLLELSRNPRVVADSCIFIALDQHVLHRQPHGLDDDTISSVPQKLRVPNRRLLRPVVVNDGQPVEKVVPDHKAIEVMVVPVDLSFQLFY